MVKQIMRLSYWLCLLSAGLALITRLLATIGTTAALFSGRTLPIGYHTFMDGVLLFFVLTIASASVAFTESRSH
jgi:hypothetical protein